MQRKDWFVALALGLVPAIVAAVLADALVVRVNRPSQAVPAATVSRAVLAPSEPAVIPTSMPAPDYLPIPTYVPMPTAITRPPEPPTITPATTITATTTITASVSPTTSPAATIQPKATDTATATSTPTPSATPTPFPYDFMVLSRVEQCDPNTVANYSGDLVTGRVLDTDGRALPGIRVRITSIHTDSPWTAETVTDGAGAFRFHLSKGNFESRVVSGSSETASGLWTRSTSETGVCRWQITFRKTNTRTPVPQP